MCCIILVAFRLRAGPKKRIATSEACPQKAKAQVAWMIRNLSLLAFLLAFQTAVFAQADPIAHLDDPVAYDVYTAVLVSHLSSYRIKPKNFVIRRETITSFGTFLNNESASSICLHPDAESKKLIGTAIEDFVRVNKTKWRLREKFDISLPYQLISAEEIIPFNNKEDWGDFYKKHPDSGGFMDLSAVGFNADWTVAIVSIGRWCGGLCGEGVYYILQKKDGKWIPLDWKGEKCSWIS